MGTVVVVAEVAFVDVLDSVASPLGGLSAMAGETCRAAVLAAPAVAAGAGLAGVGATAVGYPGGKGSVPGGGGMPG